MKKILLLLVFAALLFSCQKEKNEPVAGDQEITFSATLVQPDLKNSEDLIPCKTDVATHAHAVIDGTAYDIQVFTIGTKLYTQAIKLAPGTKTITEFFLFADDGDGVWEVGIDIMVYATPADGSPYEVYLNPLWDLPYEFEVLAFQKIEINIEVLCFVDLLYQNFGFFWFEITEIIIREACFFGDLCITDFDLWNYTPYNAGGVMPDEEAVIKVEVYVNGGTTPLTVWDNMQTYALNEPLCVEYPDVLNATDNIVFKLYVWVPTTVPGVFDWQLYGTFTTTDELPIPEAGDDKVVDFAIGTCSPNSNPIYTWLPFPTPPCSPYQGFEVNVDGWDIGFGVPTRVASGTNGITSSAGGYHAIFTEDATNESGPFTRYCGYVSTWPGTWTAEADIYLDPSWAVGEGFDYSVATNNTSGAHRRDFIFHVGVVTGSGLLVNGSNNSDFYANSYKLLNENGGNYYTVTTAGWYTFKHVFRDNAGVLAVDLILLDSGGNTLWTATRSDATDLIPSVIGGHRYGWFTFIDIAAGMAIDETNLY